MGQSNSHPSSTAGSPHEASPNNATGQPRKTPKRKESANTLVSKGTAAVPAHSLESAVGKSSKTQPHAIPGASHSRGRSQTVPTHHARPPSGSPLDTKPSAAASTPAHALYRPPLNLDTSSPAPATIEPAESTDSEQVGYEELPAPFYGPFSQFGRPPRLPLPIEEENLEPGSPTSGSPTPGSPTPGSQILKPQDPDLKVEEDGVPRSRSMLSSKSVDEEDEVDDVIYHADEIKGPTVNTLVEWKEGGEKVYVTGTWCDWSKKSRLHKDGPSKDPNAFSAILGLPSGTLYLAFLVDGYPRTAKHMPTTVDYTNVLVNYMHIPPHGTSQPVIPVDTTHIQQQVPHAAKDKDVSQPLVGAEPPTPDIRPASASGSQRTPAESTMPVRSASQTQKPPTSAPRAEPKSEVKPEAKPEAKPKPAPKKKQADDKEYHSEVPSFLLDWDAPESSSRVRRANAVSTTHQPPPQLPPYLQKSILSVTTPMKDDASVLVMPNHTVLNHLATSSIKDGVLGTSATTRYKKKFVTTIMYMPTNPTGP